MTVGIISGREGVGKTTQLLTLAKTYPDAFWIVLELKDAKNLKKEESADFKVEIGYKTNEKMRVDPIQTLQSMIEYQMCILEKKPQTIVIDGISDLRELATVAWAIKHNEETGEHRSSPKFGDYGAWGDINQTVREILEPLINFALINDSHLWMTAQMKDEYIKDVKVGQVPDIKPWMSYPVQVLLNLDRTNEGYFLRCDKEPRNAFWAVEGIEKEKGLLKALINHDLVERTQNALDAIQDEKEYMVRYGNGQKMFISAISKEKARLEFERKTSGEIKTYEVLE